MATIQANFTPIPAGWNQDTNTYTVLVHLSFVKFGEALSGQVPEKIPFGETNSLAVERFVRQMQGRSVQVNLVNPINSSETTLIATKSLPQFEEKYWRLLQYSTVAGRADNFLADSRRLNEITGSVSRKLQDTITKIQKLRTEITTILEPRIDRFNQNIQTYTRILAELSEVAVQLEPELNRIQQAGGKLPSEANEYNRQHIEYGKKKALFEKRLPVLQAELAGKKVALKQIEQEEKDLRNTKAVLEQYRKTKFIPVEQDTAIRYINEYVQQQSLSESLPGTSQYTSDVEWQDQLTFSDALGYLSAYPEFQKKLGLLFAIQFSNTLLPSSGYLQLAFSDNGGDNQVRTALHRVHYSFNREKNFFYPAPSNRNAEKYKDGYLNLHFTFRSGTPAVSTPAYALLQNNFEEIKYRRHNEPSARASDYTSGFFLVQNQTSTKLSTSETQNRAAAPSFEETLFLEDLIIGYRTDVLRVGNRWKSLHGREYKLTFTNPSIGNTDPGPLAGQDEGFIAADTVTKAFELVTIVTKMQDTTLNLATLEPNITHNFTVVAAEGVGGRPPVEINIVVEVAPAAPGKNFSFTKIGSDQIKIIVLKNTASLSNDALEAFVKDTNKAMARALLFRKWIQCDNQGRLYYRYLVDDENEFLNPDEHASPSYIPSSLICHINGYSLSTPKYMGPKLRDFFGATGQKPVAEPSSKIESFMRQQGIKLDIQPEAGSLPILRIGDRYRVRCRLVLLGGVSLPKEDENSTYALSEKQFLRQDPLPAPKLLLPDAYAEQRSNQEENFNRLLKLGDTESLIVVRTGRKEQTYPTSAMRLIAPPSVSWQMAEWLKMMDTSNMPDVAIMRQSANKKMPQYEAVPGISTYKGTSVVKWKTGTGRFERFVTPGAETPYIVDSMASYFIIEPIRFHSVNKVAKLDFSSSHAQETIDKIKKSRDEALRKLKLEFAPKFLARDQAGKLRPQCQFWDKSQVAPSDRKASHNVRVWTLKVVPGERGVQIDQARRQVIITVKQGDDIEFVIRCFTDAPEHLNAFYYVTNVGAQDKIKIGQNPTPTARVLAETRFRVIHALQQPRTPHLEDKVLDDYTTTQQFHPDRDERFPEEVVMQQGIYFTGRTCGEVYLVAEWQEVVDDIADDDIVKRGKSPLRIIKTHRKVFNYAEPNFYAKSDSTIPGVPINFFSEKVPSPLTIIDSPTNDDNSNSRIYADLEGRNLTFRHELGSAKFHSIRYYMMATSRFREYFQDRNESNFNSFRTGYFKSQGNKKEFALRATRAPAPPDVAYILPLFETKQTKYVLTKEFKGFRIYLRRPWYSSGIGEALAVVLASRTLAEANEDSSSWVSRIGRDITTGAEKASFSEFLETNNPEPNEYKLPRPGKTAIGVRVDVLPVFFDLEERLWYATLDFKRSYSEDMYCPFVRLMVARFQKLALPGLELSSSVACDFVQIYPNRTISVDHVNLTLTIDAPAVKKNGKGELLAEMRFWRVGANDKMTQDYQGILLETITSETKVGRGTYDSLTEQFTLHFSKGDKAVIIREYEQFANTPPSEGENIMNEIGLRRLYSHVVILGQL